MSVDEKKSYALQLIGDSNYVSERAEYTDDNNDRGQWSRKLDFVLSCMSYAIGLGNVWRFPYVCYRNGAGAFLIPFAIMFFMIGIPMVFLELSFGQYCSSGCVSVWRAVPLFQGVGWAMFIVSVLISIYYNMIIAYTFYYMFASFKAKLPWTECGDWSSEACAMVDSTARWNCTRNGGEWCYKQCIYFNVTIESLRNCTSPDPISPSDEYFHKVVLDITSGIQNMGKIRWELVLCLLLAWVLTCFCLIKGIKSGGKVAYFTALFPYVCLSILLVRGLLLDGAVEGIIYYFKPQWHKLWNARVWGDAAVQIFFSLSPCWGGLITLSSYNKFHNSCFKDAIIVSAMDCFTSIFAGMVIFSIIGYMATELHKPIGEVLTPGAGLAFIVYPEVVAKLPISQLWSVLFFSMLVTLGIGSQISTVTTVHTTIMDKFPQIFMKRENRKSLLLICISVICFLVALLFTFQGGMYVLQLFDNYAASYSLLIIGMTECLALSWIYGGELFLTDIQCMLGYKPSKVWLWNWRLISPFSLLLVLIFTWIEFKPSQYNAVKFPYWADGTGWVITLSSVMAIPLVLIYKVLQYRWASGSSIVQSIKHLCKPDPDWGPARKEHRQERMALNNVPVEQIKSTTPLTVTVNI